MQRLDVVVFCSLTALCVVAAKAVSTHTSERKASSVKDVHLTRPSVKSTTPVARLKYRHVLHPRDVKFHSHRVRLEAWSPMRHFFEPGAQPAEGGLTPFGAQLRTVVLAGLQVSGMCSKHHVDSWRGLLPMYIASQLQGQAEVVLFDAKHWHKDRTRLNRCKSCVDKEGITGDSFDCRKYFADSGRQVAELVIVLGTGDTDAHLHEMFNQPWVGPQTAFMHIPISHDERILRNKVARFDLVVPDEAFVKPVHLEHIVEFRETCRSQERSNTLVWVARYMEWKVGLPFRYLGPICVFNALL